MSKGAAMARADRIFSRYIRRRFADHSGRTECCTCGKVEHWRDMDCGHFISRTIMATRYNPTNCAAQCRKCNRLENGRRSDFERYIRQQWGDGHVDILTVMSKRPTAWKVTESWFKHVADIYSKLSKNQDG